MDWLASRPIEDPEGDCLADTRVCQMVQSSNLERFTYYLKAIAFPLWQIRTRQKEMKPNPFYGSQMLAAVMAIAHTQASLQL